MRVAFGSHNWQGLPTNTSAPNARQIERSKHLPKVEPESGIPWWPSDTSSYTSLLIASHYLKQCILWQFASAMESLTSTPLGIVTSEVLVAKLLLHKFFLLQRLSHHTRIPSPLPALPIGYNEVVCVPDDLLIRGEAEGFSSPCSTFKPCGTRVYFR